MGESVVKRKLVFFFDNEHQCAGGVIGIITIGPDSVFSLSAADAAAMTVIAIFAIAITCSRAAAHARTIRSGIEEALLAQIFDITAMFCIEALVV